MNNQQPPQVRIDLSQAKDILCDNCNGKLFHVVYFMKKLSALLSPTGREELIPVGPPLTPPIFACDNCGHVNKEFLSFLPKEEKEKITPEPEYDGTPKSSVLHLEK